MDVENVSFSYALGNLGIPKYWERGITGQGVKVGIFEGGIAYHEAINVAGGFANSWSGYRNIDERHGTHVAGIVAAQNLKNGNFVGVAPDVDLYSIRIEYGSKGAKRRLESIIESIDWCIENGIDIINLSLHVSEAGVTEWELRDEMRDAFQRAKDAGMIVVAAAGNNNDVDTTDDDPDNISEDEYLPKMPGVITVANFTEGELRSLSSGTSAEYVDTAAYGYRIYSTTRNDNNSSSNPSSEYQIMSGTSMSAPIVSGIFALYKQLFPNSTYQELKDKYYENCQLVGRKLRYEQGHGFPFPPNELFNLPIVSQLPQAFVRTEHGWVAADILTNTDGEWRDSEIVIA